MFESELFGHLKGAFTGAVSSTAGLFTAADGGTIFLDEVTEIPRELQVKLLRVLQNGRIRPLGSTKEVARDVRIIAATNRDIKEALAQNVLREDLYFRLSMITLHMPPLRDRLADVSGLVAHFVDKLNRRFGREIKGVEADVLKQLEAYDWPGNVRELENTIEKAFLYTSEDWITRVDLQVGEEREKVRLPVALESESIDLFPEVLVPAIQRKIYAAARGNQGVLIFGEGGAGCTIVAREIHKKSPHRNGPFIKVFCDSILPDQFEKEFFGESLTPGEGDEMEGYIHQAVEGTLFLYEIADIPRRLQTLLASLMDIDQGRMEPTGQLRRLPTNFRVVGFTNQDVHKAIEEGRLTTRFHSRLSSFSIFTPPLREQRERIRELIDFYVGQVNPQACDIDDNAVVCLMNYPWPGNHMELNHVIQGALIAANYKTIRERHLPDHVRFYQQPADVSPETGALRDVEDELEQRMLWN
ncbi:MAG: sigma 54-interacting transcriptional regulator, partial [Candidatus Latescibacteria bacterium]|nr:sigma 54-interacting transcriptional regulator [Candidatus Latescibacterota bacterium]